MKNSLKAFALVCIFACVCAAQTTVVLAPLPIFVSYTQSGTPNAFGCVFTYASGTTTPISSWTDSTGTTLNQNPVILSAGGTAQIWLQAGVNYTIKVKSAGGLHCASGSTQYTVNGVGGGASTLTTVVTYSATPTFTDISQNQLFQITLLGNAAALPLSVVGVTPPGLITFQITQDSSGGHTFTWPANVIGGAPIGLNANQVTTQQFIWNGTNATAIGPAVTGNGPSISAGAISASSLTATGSVSSGNQGTEVSVLNAGTTGTSINTLTKLTGTPSTAVIAATTDTSGIIGITVSGAGTTGSAVIQQSGTALCLFDGATTAGDYVQISATVAGNCHDFGANRPTSGQVIGQVLSTNGGGGAYSILLSAGSSASGTQLICSNASTTTVSAAVTSDQVIETCSFQPGALNTVGKLIRLNSQISLTPGGAGPPNSDVGWGFGTTSALGSFAYTFGASASATPYASNLELLCIVQTAGTSGVLLCSPRGISDGSNPPFTTSAAAQTFTLNLTSAIFAGSACKFSAGSASNTCTQSLMSVEQLN